MREDRDNKFEATAIAAAIWQDVLCSPAWLKMVCLVKILRFLTQVILHSVSNI